MKAILGLTLAGATLAPAIPAQAEPAADAALQRARFTGRVVAFDGTPIVGAAVAIADEHELDTATLLRTPPAVTGEDGRFEVPATRAEDRLEPLRLHVARSGLAAVVRELDWREPELGDIVLTAGHRLFGRVRDQDGNPLADVRVVAVDLLEQVSMLRSDPRYGFRCAGRSAASGIFELPCALSAAVRLELHKDGYERTWLEPVAADTPLEVTLRPTGWLQGRVLDADGRSVEDALVTVAYELRAAPRSVRTAADGSFRVPLDRRCRWRITARKRVEGQPLIEGHSAVLRGARDNLEILTESRAVGGTGELPVRAVRKGSGEPVPQFRAVAVWDRYAATNSSYREYRFRQELAGAAVAERGAATVPGPGKNAASAGAVRVVATGFAPATRLDVAWQEPDGDEPREPLTLELEPEATIAGVVRDEDSGAPVAGARVRARPKPPPNEGRYPDRDDSDAVVTGPDGTFRLAGLGEGGWLVEVDGPAHPSAAPSTIELETAEQRTGEVLMLPSGAVVAGTLTGMPKAAGARVLLYPLSSALRSRTTAGGIVRIGTRGAEPAATTIAADGTFAFEGVPLGNHELVLQLPSPPRRGGDLLLPIEPFRVRPAGIDRRFDCSEDRPGRIRGRIAFSHAPAALADLIVVAEPATTAHRPLKVGYGRRFAGPRSFVGRDGSFDIPVGPGSYWLSVIDIATAVALHLDVDAFEVGTGRTVDRDIELALARVDLSLAAAPGITELAAIERIEVRFVPAELAAAAGNQAVNELYDSRAGLWWPTGTETMSLTLPPGTVTFFGRNEISQLRVGGQRWQNTPLGRGELAIELEPGGGALHCPIEVGEPPVIPDGDGGTGAAAGGDADAAGQEIKGRAP